MATLQYHSEPDHNHPERIPMHYRCTRKSRRLPERASPSPRYVLRFYIPTVTLFLVPSTLDVLVSDVLPLLL